MVMDPSNPVNPYELFMAAVSGEWSAAESKFGEKGKRILDFNRIFDLTNRELRPIFR